MRITAKHPLREAIANIATYHESRSCLVDAILDACAACDIEVVCGSVAGNEGHALWTIRPANNARIICDCCQKQSDRNTFDSCISVFWYKMQSGRIELTCYIS